MDSEEQAIRELIATWLRASKAGDTATVLGLMADDAVFLQPARPAMRGRDAFAAALTKQSGVDIDATAEIQEIRVFGEWAYCWNHLTVIVTPGAAKPLRRAGNVLSVLRKLDGRWVIFRDANMLSAADRPDEDGRIDPAKAAA